MRLADLESTEIDPYIVDLVVNERLHRLGHQLNPHEQRAVITRLAGQLSDPELGALIGMTAGAVLKIRKRTKAVA